MRKSLLAVAVLGTLSFSAASFAADEAAAAPASDFTVTTNVGVFSDYIFRGLSQTAGKPALQGGVDLTHSSGLYIGAWGSNQSWLADGGSAATGGAGLYRNSSVELDVYGGYRSTIGDTGLSYDVGAIYVMYPGTRTSAAVVKADTAELYGALTYSILTFKVNYSATDFYGTANSDGSIYMDLTANYPVPAEWTGISGISAIAHVGRQKVNGQFATDNDLDYTDYKLGLAKAWDNGVSLGGYFTSTTSGTAYDGYSYKNLGSNALTGYITKTF